MSSIDFRALNLNLLPVLEALLVERTVSGAARRMGVSQSAMSHSLAKLRAALDDPLLVLSGRRMRLTPRAEAMLGELPRALEGLQRVLAGDDAFDPATSSRTFTIASFDYFDLAILPSLLAYLREHAPRVRLRVERASAATASRLVAGEIDAMLVGGSTKLSGQGLRRRELYRDPFKVIVRRDHPRVKRRLTLQTYVELDHVLVSVDGGVEGALDRALRAHDRTRRVTLRVPHFTSAPVAVATSDLVCTLASTVAWRAAELFGLRVLEPPIEVAPAPVVMAWPRVHETDPGRCWFRRVLAEGDALPAGVRRLMARTGPKSRASRRPGA